MKKFLLAAAGLIALGTSFASAADMPARVAMPAKAPVYVEPFYNWTGLYIGINGGGAWGRTNENGPFAVGSNHSISGGLIGGTLGYNWQLGNTVLGIEGDMDWANINGTGACGGGLFACETRARWLATLRGRLGYSMGRWMPYLTAGVAGVGIRNTIATVGSSTESKAGWTVGGGVETALWANWTAKLEYLYVDAGHAANVAGSEADFRSHILRAGLNYRF